MEAGVRVYVGGFQGLRRDRVVSVELRLYMTKRDRKERIKDMY